jgi:hypothetical protein
VDELNENKKIKWDNIYEIINYKNGTLLTYSSGCNFNGFQHMAMLSKEKRLFRLLNIRKDT